MQQGSYATRACGAASATAPLAPMTIRRREPGPQDVQLDVLFCGVCHSDLHQVRDEWQSAMPTVYPCVPGHEIVGRVLKTGAGVTKFKPGDLAAVGCMVDSCRVCDECRAGTEQYCKTLPTFTYNFEDKHLGGVTYGGYSKSLVVDEAYVLRVPKGLDPAAAAPLLCAGITTYSPLRHWNVGKGTKVGIVGLGGLGHMAVKIAAAFGAEVSLFTTSPGKTADAKRLGAADVLVTRDNDAELLKRAATYDFILDTVSAKHDLNVFLELLKKDGTMTLLGAPQEPAALGVFSLLFKRRRLAGSAIGGIRETQEMLDFCAAKGLGADIETIRAQEINDAYTRLLKGEVRYRFVIDMATLD
jgi:uncharacterized zinc-type alcohol dehydrogenase-like protein